MRARDWMSKGRIAVLCGISMCLAFAVGCAKQHMEELGGESHFQNFLVACDEACEEGLECLSGVCTRACDSDQACGEMHAAARCPDPSGVEIDRVCDVTCTADAQCAAVHAGFVCAAGVCREGEIEDTPGDEQAPLAMLLVDTSGSMERLIECECVTPACVECLPDCESGERNRFATLLEALSGTWEDFECEPLSRQSADETSEIDFTYDQGYYLPYNRPPVGQEQLGDGVLDIYRTRVRFGMATFDGWDTYLGAPPLVPTSDFSYSQSDGVSGLWSYGSFVDGVVRTRENGHPVGGFSYVDTSVAYQIDTGIRGPSAPEGAVQQSYSTADMLEANARIQSDLRKLRPYGGTPIAASLDDLLYYFTEDDAITSRMTDSQEDRHVILITDGYPDDDYRTFGCNCANEGDPSDSTRCGATSNPENAFCPYPTFAEAATALTARGVAKVHVVLIAADGSVDVEPGDGGVELDRPVPWTVSGSAHAIAVAGGTGEAHVVRTPAGLRAALETILEGILGAEAPAVIDCDERPTGAYLPEYTLVSGNCGADALEEAFDVVIGDGSSNPETRTEQRSDSDITTEVDVMDCSLRFTQTVTTKEGVLVMRIETDALSIHANGIPRGVADVERYDEAGELACQGTYSVQLHPLIID